MSATAILLIKLYRFFNRFRHQALLSVFGYSSVCKHTPSCSEYAVLQIREHGTILGSWRAFLRIIRCW